jgi:hypothetical protein
MEEDILNTFDETPGFNDCISSNLPPRAMRYSMENKNNLKEKGSIYVGLGTKRTTTINVNEIIGVKEDGMTNETKMVTEKFEIPETGIITPPKSRGTYVLVCKVDDNGNVEEMGWVNAASITSGSIVSGIKNISN